MVSIQPWSLMDIWDYARVNIDEWTETYSVPFYLHYSLGWPAMNYTLRNNNEQIIGYILGSAKNSKPETAKGHVTAVTVCEDYRRLGLASQLMSLLELASDYVYKAQFVDLFVRPTNQSAQTMYKKMGYVLYRQIIKYYSTINEDGYDMRKSMPRDKNKKFMVPLPNPVLPGEVEDD